MPYVYRYRKRKLPPTKLRDLLKRISRNKYTCPDKVMSLVDKYCEKIGYHKALMTTHLFRGDGDKFGSSGLQMMNYRFYESYDEWIDVVDHYDKEKYVVRCECQEKRSTLERWSKRCAVENMLCVICSKKINYNDYIGCVFKKSWHEDCYALLFKYFILARGHSLFKFTRLDSLVGERKQEFVLATILYNLSMERWKG